MNGNRFRLARQFFFFLLGLAALLILLSLLFIPKRLSEKAGFGDPMAEAIRAETPETIDVLVLGNSLPHTAIDPLTLFEQEGITAYDVTTSGQYIYNSLEYYDLAEKNQSPSLVVLDADVLYYGFEDIDTVLSRVGWVVPAYRFHNRWKSLRNKDFFSLPSYTRSCQSRGYYGRTLVNPAADLTWMEYTDEVQLPEKNCEKYLRKLLKACQKRGASLLLVSTPSLLNWNYKKHNAVAALAKELSIPYLDMNLMPEEIPIDWTTDTRDMGDHLNHPGALKVSRYFAGYLAENYDLSDHREDPACSSWYKALKRRKRGKEIKV